MLKTLQKSNLFRGLSLEEIQEFIKNSGATTVTYDKNEILFHMGQKPTHLFVLLKGAIAVCRDSVSGKRMVVTNIDDIGDIFAEVYLFLPKESYDYYSVAIQSPTTVLKIPKSVFQGDSNQHFDKLIANMLLILSQKAYNLTQKLQILASGNLRQKLSKMLLEGMDEDNNLILGLNREQLADYLNVARPSLSRELTNMQAEGLIKVKGRQIKILDPEGMEM